MTEVLWVDDNKHAGRDTAKRLERSNNDISVTSVYSVAEAIENLERGGVDCVISGYDLPDGTAYTVFEHARDQQPGTFCILYCDTPPTQIDMEGARVKSVDRRRENSYSVLEQIVQITSQQDFDLDSLDFQWSPVQEALDRISEIAAVTLEARAAFIAQRVRDQEKIIASYGLDPEHFSRTDKVRYPSIDEDVISVTGVRSDDSLEGSFYKHFGIRSYMGAELDTGLGRAILCIVDDRRRDFTAEEEYLLRTIAREAEDQLELRARYVSVTQDTKRQHVDTS